MRLLDTVTLYHKSKTVYIRTIIDGCYWYGNTGISDNGHGIVRDDSITVFFPATTVKDLKIHRKDIIVKGIAPSVTSVNELAGYEDRIMVLAVNENIVGSSLDNITVTGK